MTTKWTAKVPESAGMPTGPLSDEYVILLLYGKNSFGDKIYSYLKVTLPNLQRLKAAGQGGSSFNPSDFGEVVAAGTGEPTPEVQAEIRMTYHYTEIGKRPPAPAAEAIPAPVPIEKKAWDEY